MTQANRTDTFPGLAQNHNIDLVSRMLALIWRLTVELEGLHRNRTDLVEARRYARRHFDANRLTIWRPRGEKKLRYRQTWLSKREQPEAGGKEPLRYKGDRIDVLPIMLYAAFMAPVSERAEQIEGEVTKRGFRAGSHKGFRCDDKYEREKKVERYPWLVNRLEHVDSFQRRVKDNLAWQEKYPNALPATVYDELPF